MAQRLSATNRHRPGPPRDGLRSAKAARTGEAGYAALTGRGYSPAEEYRPYLRADEAQLPEVSSQRTLAAPGPAARAGSWNNDEFSITGQSPASGCNSHKSTLRTARDSRNQDRVRPDSEARWHPVKGDGLCSRQPLA